MSLEQLLVGILAIAIGVALLLWGYRLGLILIPIWGFFAGFLVGVEVVQAIFGDGFLSTVTSWVGGIGVGILFAILSYFFWYAAIVILFGALGYFLGAGVMTLFGLSTDAVITIIVGAVVGLVFAGLAFISGTPLFYLVVATALSGAHGVVAGILVLFNIVNYEQLGDGLVDTIISQSAWWWIVVFVLAAVGVYYQIRSIGDFVLDWNNRGMAGSS